MPQIDQALAERLRLARLTAKLSQDALAAKIGVTSAQVSRIENGLRSPRTATLYAWLKACGYGLEAVEIGDESTTAEIMDLVDVMTQADLELSLRIMRAMPRLPVAIRGALVGLIAPYEP